VLGKGSLIITQIQLKNAKHSGTSTGYRASKKKMVLGGSVLTTVFSTCHVAENNNNNNKAFNPK
jgi:hypothetical protein